MIYGVNFGAPAVPEHLRHKFANTTRGRLGGLARGKTAHLVGLCTTSEELRDMLIIADNGRRKLHTTTRTTQYGPFHAIYVSYED